jgi:uncharacterized protein (DUF924 family)
VSTAGDVSAADVLAFWRAAGADKWFKKDEAFDAEIVRRYSALWGEAAAGSLPAWEDTPEAALALVILLDQFPRNMFRGDARAFATDTKARGVADRATTRGFDRAVPTSERLFFYLPFEHSESEADQARAITLIAALGDADLTRWAQLHADIIKRFGRFPHRNTALGRTSTREEQAFLDAGGFSG